MSILSEIQIKNIIFCALLVASEPLSKARVLSLFTDEELPEESLFNSTMVQLREELESLGLNLVEVSSGYQCRVSVELSPWMGRLVQQKPPKYSRAVLETLALIAYRQPVTRAEIEDVRGVAVGGQIIKTLMDREWIHIVGHREVPGRPVLFATTKQFLDDFNLKRLDDLPPLPELLPLLQESDNPLQESTPNESESPQRLRAEEFFELRITSEQAMAEEAI